MSVSAPHFMLFAHVTGNTLVGAPSRGQANADAETTAAEYGGRWRFVLQSPEGETVLDAEDEEEGNSRERLELLAIVRGLEALDQPSQVTLHTQSQAISRGIREGLNQWRENDYQWERFGSLTPIKNSDLWRRVDQALQIHQVNCKLTIGTGSDDLNLPESITGDAVDFSATASAVTMPKPRRVRGKQLRFDAGEPASTATAKASPRRTRARQPAAATSLWQRAVGGVRSLFSNGDR
ncbi:RNase H family protein [Anatilimnocola floriformis]|uniref:RNase H family protein n=1 Tax=Anatilimnocola floriformis TaxID=2948575 RepID=UPI0020C1ED6A|nr:RNase H family protein [Anatilimnocola floriformis]